MIVFVKNPNIFFGQCVPKSKNPTLETVLTILHSKNGTWAKSYRTRFLPSQSEKLKHIFWSVCAKIKESNWGHSF